MNKTRLHPVMLAGTGSDVGKSVLATALCRIFKQDGYRPAPFKAQNMALNSYATPDGLEIGRAQAVQAEAAGIDCSTDMNPLLLKPNSDHTSQVVLNGRPAGNQSAYAYFRKEGRDQLRKEVYDAFDRLDARYNPIVMEGAGSIAEINLRDTDLVNMPMAIHAQADIILVGDIDRGGVFASVYGSIMLQRPEERKRIKGIIINKFRGDIRLFEDGRRMLEQLCGIPVLGVVPYFKDIHIEEEDSVDLAQKSRKAKEGKVNIAVILLRHLSNFTDFDSLEHDPRIHLYYTRQPDDLQQADIIILPGSKSTISDLHELQRDGLAQAIVQARQAGKTVMGICGGYQMMGHKIFDRDHVEGETEHMDGLGLLPVWTTLTREKVTRQRDGICLPWTSSPVTGLTAYEIHMGQTEVTPDTQLSPFAYLADGKSDGYRLDERCMGTYLHGILDNHAFVNQLIHPYLDSTQNAPILMDYRDYKEEQYDRLAAHVRKHVDINRLYQILTSEA